ncbi:MAG: S53 family peptidase [Ktedonobacteraceae bacterium]|nr:S53 family peptidase [Ktedonobacteraceae bacterium]
MIRWLMYRSSGRLVAVCFLLFGLLISSFSVPDAALARVKRTGLVSIYPLMQYATRIRQIGTSVFPPCLHSAAPPLCYSPQQMQQIYNFSSLVNAGSRGRGQTIVIIDAYQSPTLRDDLHLFNSLLGLPEAQLDIIAPFGLHPFHVNNPYETSFALEIGLDVEWAHAMAPEAQIVLVLGNPANDTDRGQIDALIAATRYAVDRNLGSVMSLSVGAAEACFSAAELQSWHDVFRRARDRRISVFVSAGDTGSNAGTCDANGNSLGDAQGVEYPASDPLVTAVGGTTLLADRAGTYQSEATWNESARGKGATGGGYSKQFRRPAYQGGNKGIMRAIPDVAYDADPLTSVPVVSGSYMAGSTVIVPVGGTSAGAPQWAAMVALANQASGARLGFLNAAFYRIGSSPLYASAFHDITSGDNTFTIPASPITKMTIPGFTAGPGWDAVTGLGSPIASVLAHLLVGNIRPGDGTGL